MKLINLIGPWSLLFSCIFFWVKLPLCRKLPFLVLPLLCRFARRKVESPFASRAGRQRSEVKETAAEWRSRDTKFLTLAGSRWCHLNGRYRRRVTFGVVVRSLVPNRRMSNSFPCGSWPDHSVPDGKRGISV